MKRKPEKGIDMVELLKKGYKMLIADFDNTLARFDSTVSLKVKEATERYREEGGIFVVCSGRALPSTRLMMRLNGIEGMVAACHGAVVADESDNILTRMEMEISKALKCLSLLEEREVFYIVFADDILVCNFDCERRLLYEKSSGCPVEVKSNVPEWLKGKSGGVQKILVIDDPEALGKLSASIGAGLPEGVNVSGSSNHFMEIVDEKSTKGKAVEFLAGKYGLDRREVIAVGDSAIDVPMLRAAGLGVAVRNASRVCKEGAGAVCQYSCDEDAVGHIITDKEWTE